jgi:hypothetical protein
VNFAVPVRLRATPSESVLVLVVWLPAATVIGNVETTTPFVSRKVRVPLSGELVVFRNE